uniref:non-specific serine/threonine protein kinase n=1 Tax=Oryza barthii TaxID=65489 RepID=A0A0D3H5T5_9ORYZ
MGFSAAQLVFFSVLALLLVNVHAEPTSLGFVSIDCGLSGRPYVDEITNISYVSDDAYIATGEKHEISSEYRNLALYRSGLSLRSFPSGGRNCYAVAAAAARGRSKYLVRAWFMHGDYDGGGGSLASTPVRFDLYIGLAFWFEMTVSDAATTYAFEAITVAAAGGSSSSLSVCLVDNGHGTPFVSSLEVRPMSSDMYPDAVANQSLGLFTRGNMGASYFLRYPEDPYDRLWWTPSYGASSWLNVSARDTSSISYAQTDHIRVPVAVLRTAITTANTSVPLVVNTYSTSIGRVPPPADAAYFHFLHFADFDQQQQQRQKRRFDIYYGSSTRYVYRNEPVQLNPIHNRTTPSYYASGAYSLSNVSLVATNGSVLPPLLNAMEVYYSIPHDGIATAPHDVDAIMAIKTEYQVKKNWMGDPCLPKEFIWTGLQCRREGTEYKIISLDLSYSNLNGAISADFSLLQSLQSLNLSHNNLSGSVPDSLTNLSSLILIDLSGNHFNGTLPEALCTKSSLNLRYDTSNGDPCNGMKSPKKKNISVRTLTVAIVTPVVAVLLVSAVLILCFCKKKRKQNVTEGLVQQYSPCSIQPTGTPDSGSHVDLKDHIQMADDHEFTYEELVRITNNFSDCIGEGGFGPVYRGQLQDSVQVAVKKSSRASLHGQGIREFLADINSLQTVHHRHLVLLIGYCTNRDHLALIYEYMPNGSLFDHIRAKYSKLTMPLFSRYYFSSRLTMRSDVFSFGVVLLETVTGEPPIMPGVGHVVQRVKQKVSDGDISGIVDPRLKGAYDMGSVWKVVDIALLCTREVSDDRPTMTEVVEHLKDAFALEEARHIDPINDNSQGNINTDLSANWGPSAR